MVGLCQWDADLGPTTRRSEQYELRKAPPRRSHNVPLTPSSFTTSYIITRRIRQDLVALRKEEKYTSRELRSSTYDSDLIVNVASTAAVQSRPR